MSFAAEDRLLLECSRVELTDSNRRRAAELVEAGLDWDAVVEASIRHAVAPLLLHGLEQASLVQRLPAPVAAELGTLRERSRVRGERLYAALGEVLDGLAGAGVEVVALKDIQLAAQVYPDRALRPMGDLDLLIHRDDYESAGACLRALGFRPAGEEGRYASKYGSGLAFSRTADEVWVDLQWRILEREWDRFGESAFSFEVEPLWERARQTSIDGRRLLVPSSEDMLYHLCGHLEGHRYGELILFCDVAELLRVEGPHLDWARFVELTRVARGESCVYYVLLLVERLLGVELPAGLLGELEPRYRRGSLTTPLYGNLGSLHRSLDQIRGSALPPEALLGELEPVVRRQAVRAMRVEDELDELAAALHEAGGTLILFDGEPPPRLFPDPALPAFGPLEAFVLAAERPTFLEALAARGFELTDGQRAMKAFEIVSADPVLAGSGCTLTLAVEIASDVVAALERSESASNREAGLRSLRARLSASADADARAEAVLTVYTLTPDELLACLAVRLGRDVEERLFALAGALELAVGLSDSADWGRAAAIADRHGAGDDLRSGLLVLEDALEPAHRRPVPGAGLPSPRVFEWARYGSGTGRSPALRRAYYVAFSFLSAEGGRAKRAYLRRALFGVPGAPAVVPGLARDLGSAVVQRLRAGRPKPRDLAYWARPVAGQR